MILALALLQLSVIVSAPDTMRVNGNGEITVRVAAPAGRRALLTPPAFAPFVIVRAQTLDRVDAMGGGRLVSEYRYTVSPTRVGRFALPSFVARSGALVAASRPQQIVVTQAPGQPRVPVVVTRAVIDTALPVTFRALVSPETVYVGQQATYELGVFLEESVRDRLRRMEAIAPEMRGLMAYDAPLPSTGFPQRMMAGRRYESHVYQRAIFPLAPGRYVLPPARLVYAMPLNYSFFSREESFELRSDSVVVVALDPPLATRPADFSGAVGELSVAATLDSAQARVGDPLSLTVRVSGSGNVKLFPRPTVTIPWASVLAADDQVQLENDSLRIRGSKDFRYVVTPLRAGQQSVPPLRYSFFNPAVGRYEIAESNAIPLLVAPGTLAAADSVAPPAATRLALRARYRGDLAPPLYSRRAAWWLLALVPIPALVAQVARRPRRRHQPRAARRLRAITRHAGVEAAREARGAFLRAVGDRLGVQAAALAEPASIERLLRRSGTSPETAARAAAVLVALDRASFAAAPSAEPDVARDAYRVYLAIDREARRTADNASAALPLVVIALIAGATTLRALAPLPGEALFDHGATSYQRGRYADATAAFQAVTAAAPRAADAWANLGTAAWAAGDTARAVRGWERALRLEPSASDARERLDLVPTLADDPLATVPPFDPTPLAVLAALIWCATWGVVAIRPRGAPMRTLALGGSAAAIVLAAAVFTLDTSLAATDLAVLDRATALRIAPAPGAERGVVLGAGSIVRVRDRDAEWTHVTVDADRDGWVDSASLLSLARP